jgi:hypothetical protein
MPFFILSRNAVGLSPTPFLEGRSATTRLGRSSGFRVVLLVAPSRPFPDSGFSATFVTGYSGGTATESHRLPFFSPFGRPIQRSKLHPLPGRLSVAGRREILRKGGGCAAHFAPPATVSIPKTESRIHGVLLPISGSLRHSRPFRDCRRRQYRRGGGRRTHSAFGSPASPEVRQRIGSGNSGSGD